MAMIDAAVVAWGVECEARLRARRPKEVAWKRTQRARRRPARQADVRVDSANVRADTTNVQPDKGADVQVDTAPVSKA